MKAKLLITSLSLIAISAYAQPSLPSAGMPPPTVGAEIPHQAAPSMPQPAMQRSVQSNSASSSVGAVPVNPQEQENIARMITLPPAQPVAGATGGASVAKPSNVAPSSSEINGRTLPIPPLPPTSTPAVKLANPRTGEVASEIKTSGEGKDGIKEAAAGATGSQANARPPLPDSQAGNSGVSLNNQKDVQSVGTTQSKSLGMLSRPAYIAPMTPGKVVFSLGGADSLFHGSGVLHSSNEVGATKPAKPTPEEIKDRIRYEASWGKYESWVQSRPVLSQLQDLVQYNESHYGKPFDISIAATWAVCIHPQNNLPYDASDLYWELGH
jgi:hypothetical protein